jgi:hypothetical protein
LVVLKKPQTFFKACLMALTSWLSVNLVCVIILVLN